MLSYWGHGLVEHHHLSLVEGQRWPEWWHHEIRPRLYCHIYRRIEIATLPLETRDLNIPLSCLCDTTHNHYVTSSESTNTDWSFGCSITHVGVVIQRYNLFYK